MAGHEDQAQEVVTDVVVEGGLEVGRRPLFFDDQPAAELVVLAVEPPAAAHEVDRAMLGGPHQPGAGPLRHARLRPLLQGRDERILRHLLGQLDAAHDPDQAGDEAGGLDPPHRLDRRPRVSRCHLA